MPKIFNYDEGALKEALDRIKSGTDAGSEDPRPSVDPRERRELIAQAGGPRKAEQFATVLEAHGFVWYPAQLMPLDVGAAAAGQEHEGQWRNRRARLAFTPTDLLAQFDSPEDLDRWARQKARERRLMADPNVSKAERRIALSKS